MPQPAMKLKIYPNSGNNCNSRMKCLKKSVSALASKIDVVAYKIFDLTCQVEVNQVVIVMAQFMTRSNKLFRLFNVCRKKCVLYIYLNVEP